MFFFHEFSFSNIEWTEFFFSFGTSPTAIVLIIHFFLLIELNSVSFWIGIHWPIWNNVIFLFSFVSLTFNYWKMFFLKQLFICLFGISVCHLECANITMIFFPLRCSLVTNARFIRNWEGENYISTIDLCNDIITIVIMIGAHF